MTKFTEEILCDRAIHLHAFFRQELEEQDIANSIIDQYVDFCKTPDAKRLGIAQRQITDELRLRLWFECLCFCTHCACEQAVNFIQRRRWLIRVPDIPKVQLFHGAIAAALLEACIENGSLDLREIDLIAFDPSLQFGFAERLDPLVRLEVFRSLKTEKNGNDASQFAKLIGLSLDAPHYPLLEMLAFPWSVVLLRFSNAAMKGAFADSDCF